MTTEPRDRGELRAQAIRSVLDLVYSQPETVATWITPVLQRKGLEDLAARHKLKRRANKQAPEVPHNGESMFSMLTWFVKKSAQASSNDSLGELFQLGLAMLREDVLHEHGFTLMEQDVRSQYNQPETAADVDSG